MYQYKLPSNHNWRDKLNFRSQNIVGNIPALMSVLLTNCVTTQTDIAELSTAKKHNDYKITF